MFRAKLFGLIFSAMLAAIAVSIASAASNIHSQHDNNSSNHHHHSQTMNSEKAVSSAEIEKKIPTEPGQAAFAAISEIVEILTSDPNTDWSKVDIDGLREHLIDMSELSLRASSKTVLVEDRIEIIVTGKGRTLAAIKRMVPAHTEFLAQNTDWKIKSKLTVDGAIMSILPKDAADSTRIKSLGFIGIMAIGAHHQEHHLAIARGFNHAHQ